MKSNSIMFLFIFLVVGLTSCTKNDQVVTESSSSTNVLNAYKTATVPTIDGTADAIWSKATELSVNPIVPNPGNGLFMGYCGEQYPATIKAMYDANNIYFLVKWDDSTNVTAIQPWVFDAVAHTWSQRGNARTFDVNGNLTKLSMGLDQLAFQFDINNSTQNFASQTCYASCHLFTPYRNYAGAMVANASGNHYTNGSTEKVDLWWAKLNRDVLANQMDDWYLDDGGGQSYYDTLGGSANGRHANGQIKPTPFTTTYILPSTKKAPSATYSGPYSNSQTLAYTLASGKSVSVKVPLYVETGAAKPYYNAADVTSGTALKVTAVDSMGVLTLSDNSTIDPNADPASYKDDAGVGRNIGAKCFPSFILQPFVNERANLKTSAVYTGTGWVVEIQRALKTGDVLKQDVDFTDLTDRPFGIAIWNQSNYQHGIQPNLLLHFNK